MNKNRATRHIISLRKIALALSASLAVVTVFSCRPSVGLSAATNFSNDSQVKSYQNQLATIEKNLKSLQSSMASTKIDINNQLAEKAKLDKEISLLYDKIEVQNALLDELSVGIAEKEIEIAEKQTEYDARYELFKERLRITYEDGDASYIAMLFGAQSLSDFLSRIDRIGAMLDYDTNIMSELQSQKTDLEEYKLVLEESKAEQEAITAQYRLDQAAISEKAKATEQYISSLRSNTAAYQAMQAENEKKRAELEAELEERIKELEKQNSKYVGGDLLWPVPVQYTRITSECGWRTSPITGKLEYHNGVDIPVPYGTDIYAANEGTVVTAANHYSYGNYIMLDHGGGIITLYAHNSKLLVKVGDKVKRGQVIAKAGSSGASTGNHCHFSIRESGTWVNHKKYFPD